VTDDGNHAAPHLRQRVSLAKPGRRARCDVRRASQCGTLGADRSAERAEGAYVANTAGRRSGSVVRRLERIRSWLRGAVVRGAIGQRRKSRPAVRTLACGWNMGPVRQALDIAR